MNTTMNTNTQAQATTTLVEAVTAIATQLKDLVDLAKAESTVTTATTTEVTTTEATTETTAVTTTTEATGETVGYLPCFPEETVTSTADVVQITEETVAETATRKIDLDRLYKTIKYVIEKEGNMVRMDHSPYAPAKNTVVDINKHTVYLSKTNEEVKIIVVEINYYNPSIIISVNDKREFLEEVKTLHKDALKADTKLNKVLDVLRDIISLTM